MKDIIEFYNAFPQINVLIPAVINLITLILCIVWYVAYRKKSKSSKEWRENYLIKVDEKIGALEAHKATLEQRIELQTKFETLQEAYKYILKVNKGMCIKREKIIHEIVDDTFLREKAMSAVLEMFIDRKPDPEDIPAFFNEVYKCLKPKDKKEED